MNDIVAHADMPPFDILVDYERRSLAHATGAPEQIEAPGTWRGIGFRVGANYLVSSLAEVNEILAYPVNTQVPGTRSWLLGVANVRGNLVPVIDLNQFLSGEASRLTDTSRVLLVRQQGGSVGLLVDEVLGQRNFAQQQRESRGAGEPAADAALLDHFVTERYALGDVRWGQFSMAALVRAPEFLRAAA
jgi:twitching motility protein PilI